MKVLIISPSKGLYDSQSDGYNGVGWVASLQQYLEKEQDIELAMAFVTPAPLQKEKRGNTMYYPIHIPDRSGLKKLYYYWQGYKKDVFDKSIVILLKEVIEDFSPDIIHIFGTESNLGYIIGETDVPCVVHIQGILSSVVDVYYPPGFNGKNFKSIKYLREYWLRNGIVFNYQRMRCAAKREREFLSTTNYFIGRTEWDKQLSTLYNPKASYYHVDEILRPYFYEAKKWQNPQSKKIILLSTISSNTYKGLDLILKTASILKSLDIDFRWKVIGINNNYFTRIIEKKLQIFHDAVNINYLGIKDVEEIICSLQQATMYIHPSHIDNSPNSLCEAQYLGLPCIATNVGGVSTIMYNNTEYLIPANDAYLLASKIITLQSTLSKRIDVTVNHERVIERHSPKRVICSLKEAYAEILKKHTENK